MTAQDVARPPALLGTAAMRSLVVAAATRSASSAGTRSALERRTRPAEATTTGSWCAVAMRVVSWAPLALGTPWVQGAVLCVQGVGAAVRRARQR